MCGRSFKPSALPAAGLISASCSKTAAFERGKRSQRYPRRPLAKELWYARDLASGSPSVATTTAYRTCMGRSAGPICRAEHYETRHVQMSRCNRITGPDRQASVVGRALRRQRARSQLSGETTKEIGEVAS